MVTFLSRLQVCLSEILIKEDFDEMKLFSSRNMYTFQGEKRKTIIQKFGLGFFGLVGQCRRLIKALVINCSLRNTYNDIE